METGGAFCHSKIGSHHRGAESRERFSHQALVTASLLRRSHSERVMCNQCFRNKGAPVAMSMNICFRTDSLGSVNLVNPKGNHPGQGHNPLTDTVEMKHVPPLPSTTVAVNVFHLVLVYTAIVYI